MSNQIKIFWISVLTLFALVCLSLTAYIYFSDNSLFWKVPSATDETVGLSSAEELGFYYDQGNIDRALTLAEVEAEKKSGEVKVLLALATIYAEKGSVSYQEELYGKKAIDTAQKALAINPNSAVAYQIIGYAYEIMQNYAEAHKNYDFSLDINPYNAETNSNKGHAYDLQGDLKLASHWYKRALNIDANNEHALLNYTRLLVRQNNFIDAEIYAQKLIAITKNKNFSAQANQILAYIYMSQKDVDYVKARVAIETAISLDPLLPQAWVTQGLIYMNTLVEVKSQADFEARIAKIEESINRALAINKNQASAYYLASLVAIVKNDPKTERLMNKKALEAIPLDITLGIQEKLALKNQLESSLVVIDIDEKTTRSVQPVR